MIDKDNPNLPVIQVTLSMDEMSEVVDAIIKSRRGLTEGWARQPDSVDKVGSLSGTGSGTL